MSQQHPQQFRMKDLFIDVKLEACVGGSTFDFLGRKLFSAGFFRNNIGFGITSIDIEVNTSLQPLVVVTFKDLYGNTIFGSQTRSAEEDGQSIDYSVLFNWPPPKFLFSFKGYLGKPTTWVLNLKRTSTSFNSSDGSYDVKCEFVPNQWGFFADLPFLYLLAAKRLRKDKVGQGSNLTEEQRAELSKGVISVFDLIKIGKQVEVKTQETSKEFDDLLKQLGSIKSNISRSMVITQILGEGEVIDGVVNNQPIGNTTDESSRFVEIKVPEISKLPDQENLGSKQKLEEKIGRANSLAALNVYLLLSLQFKLGGTFKTGFDLFGSGIPTNWKSFFEAFNSPGSQSAQDIESARLDALAEVNKNIERVDEEVRRRVFASSKVKLEKITIGEIFAQLARDAAFVMGSILDAGLEGYMGDTSAGGRQSARDNLVDDGILIGESFPLTIKDGQEVPAIAKNLEVSGGDSNGEVNTSSSGIVGGNNGNNNNSTAPSSSVDVDGYEMKFVKNFINAVSEGISKDLLTNSEQVGQDDSKLKQRINNMEMAEGNPYKANYRSIATNILVRSGIAAYFTRSNDPNLPGDYSNGTFEWSRDSAENMEALAERDMQNVTDNIIKNLSDIDFLLLQRFSKFFRAFFTSDGEGLANANGVEAEGISNLTPKSTYANWKVVLNNPPVNGQVGDETSNPLNDINSESSINFNGTVYPTTVNGLAGAGVEVATFSTIWGELRQEKVLENYQLVNDELVYEEIEDEESKRADQEIETTSGAETFQEDISRENKKNAQNPLSLIDGSTYTATRVVNNSVAYYWPAFNPGQWYAVFFENDAHDRASEANSAPTDSEYKSEDKDMTESGVNEILGYAPINSKYGEEGDFTTEVGNGKYILNRVTTAQSYRDGTTYGPSAGRGGRMFRHSGCKKPPSNFYGNSLDSNNFSVRNSSREVLNDVMLWNGSVKESPNDLPNLSDVDQEYASYPGRIGFTVCAEQPVGRSAGLLFGIFEDTREGRNQRVYIKKCAEILEEKVGDIIDERNQIIGQVLGKSGESEELIYKQMHTLFHQWQTLAYSDAVNKNNGCLVGDINESRGGQGDKSGAFNVAAILENRFGNNHRNMSVNEELLFSKEELLEGANFSDDEIESLKTRNGLKVLSLSNPIQSNGVPDGTFIYDFPLQRLNPPEGGATEVNVRDAIINLESLYKPNANTSVLNIIQQVCTKNNFLFVPIPGNPSYLSVQDIYSPSVQPANIEVKNFFHVLFTPTPESRAKTKNKDGTPLALSENHRNYQADSFVIKYGSPDNQVVKNIQVGTDDTKVTAESIINLQRLVDNDNQSKKVTTDCSMLPVLAGRSYKATIDIIGNSQVYPMQFFYLENSPLFGGLYQIMKVKHSISPNDMETSLEGIRMRFASGSYGGVFPVTLDTFIELGESLDALTVSEGFDKADRDALKEYENGIPAPGNVVGRFTTGEGDYIGVDFVNGVNGGPVAQSVQLLPANQLNALGDTYLGQRVTWFRGVAIGREIMYIYDGYPLTGKVLSAYKAMQDAAFSDGIQLHLTSGYRDPFNNLKNANGGHISSSQYSLRRNNVKDKSKRNDDDWLRTAPSSEFSPATAPPGYSNHNSGLAIDLNCGGARFKNFNQEIYEWLILNAYKYGFVRTVSSEEWHWEYRPGTPMFGYNSPTSKRMTRNGKKWYGLPSKLGIPIDKPSNNQNVV